MTDIIVFHKGTAVALVKGSLNQFSVSYVTSKKKIVSLPLQIVFVSFLNGHCRAVLVASEQTVTTSSVIDFYDTITDGQKPIPINSVGKVIQKFERSQKKQLCNELFS